MTTIPSYPFGCPECGDDHLGGNKEDCMACAGFEDGKTFAAKTNNIMFITGDISKPVMEFCENGDIFIRGQKIENNEEVYQAAVAFFDRINKPFQDVKET